MTRILSACLVALVAALLASTRSAETYYDDTHYGFTYYMARACGYTPMQAHRVASADVGVDYSNPTEPIQWKRTTDYNPLLGDPEEPRVRFHAMRDDRPIKVQTREDADAAMELQQARLWRLAHRQRNPGVFLHFLQDKTSHYGYASLRGHWFPPGTFRAIQIYIGIKEGLGIPQRARQLEDPSLDVFDFGATTDYLSNKNGPPAAGMVLDTLQALARYMTEVSTGQRLRPCPYDKILPVFEQLVDANPMSPTVAQYASQAYQKLGEPIKLEFGAPCQGRSKTSGMY